MDFSYSPGDEKYGEKRELERNIGNYAGPDESDEQSRESETCQNLFFSVEQHGQLVNANHDRRAYRRNHRAGQRRVKHHCNKRAKGSDLQQIPTQQQISVKGQAEADQSEHDQP